MHRAVHTRAYRPDIQGLRAVAVGLVMLFHIWPGLVPGGYVGVDVFFVISGFLITGLLVREIKRTGRLSISSFYARRIRRLLPAATFVLIAIGILSLFFLPKMRLQDTAAELAASALYVENVLLYLKAVDYLAQDAPPSPVQHYWSLSIEEQYYIVWPLLLAAGVALFRSSRYVQKVMIGIGVTVFVASLTHSFLATRSSPAGAYFSTLARMWEFALGGLAAFLPEWRPITISQGKPILRRVGMALTWFGVAGIVTSALVYSRATPFPGLAAMLPTLATMGLIIGGSALFSYSSTLLGLRPLQYLGDISYSLYLWHWPLVVFYGLSVDRNLNAIDGSIIIALSIGLAHATKVFVEDPIRYRTAGTLLAALRVGGAFTAICLSLAAAQYFYIWDRKREVIADQSTDRSHPGALALIGNTSPGWELGFAFRPDLLHVRKDIPALYGDGCHVPSTSAVPFPCEYGDLNGKKVVALVGDSHAAQWLPALQRLAAERHWKIVTQTKSSCPLIDVAVGAAGTASTTCREWNSRVIEDLVALRPDLVVTSQVYNYVATDAKSPQNSRDLLAEGLRRSWGRLTAKGTPVVAIRTTPHLFDVPDCLSKNGANPAKCGLSRDKAILALDPIVAAAVGAKDVVLADMNDAICTAERCEPIVGNVLVYRDAHHLTATYSTSLAPVLERFIDMAWAQEEAHANHR